LQANLGHWANEIRKHMDLPENHLAIQDMEDPLTAQELVKSDRRIVLVARETISELYEIAASGYNLWLFQVWLIHEA
jgi:hypothetical protein